MRRSTMRTIPKTTCRKMRSSTLSFASMSFFLSLMSSNDAQIDDSPEAEGELLSPTLLKVLPPELHSYQPPRCPCVRYKPWSDLNPTEQFHATNLNYKARSWNHHRAYNGLEELYYDALTPEQQSNATALGYDQHSWTCCINHYNWHHWGHMGNWYPKAQEAYALLGWNKASWNRDFDYPSSEYRSWCRNVTGEVEDVCLTELELWALQRVCYATESVYQYDSLIEPRWGEYLKPRHCRVERSDEDALNQNNNSTDWDSNEDASWSEEDSTVDDATLEVEENFNLPVPTPSPVDIESESGAIADNEDNLSTPSPVESESEANAEDEGNFSPDDSTTSGGILCCGGRKVIFFSLLASTITSIYGYLMG